MATALALLDLRVSMVDALSDLIADYEVSDDSPRTTHLFDTHITRLAIFLAVESGVKPIPPAKTVTIDQATDVTIDEVTTAAVTRFLAREKARGLKPASLNISLRTIRTFFEWCIKHDHLAVNPAKRVSTPRVVVEPVQFMTDEQIALLLSVTAKDRTVEGVRDGALIRVARDTGVRRGELVGMRLEDVSLEDRTIAVRAITSKNRKGRTVGIAKDTVTALRTYLRVRAAYLKRMGRQDEGMLWIRVEGRPVGERRLAGAPPPSGRRRSAQGHDALAAPPLGGHGHPERAGDALRGQPRWLGQRHHADQPLRPVQRSGACPERDAGAARQVSADVWPLDAGRRFACFAAVAFYAMAEPTRLSMQEKDRRRTALGDSTTIESLLTYSHHKARRASRRRAPAGAS